MMKKKLTQFLIFILILVVFDQVAGYMLRKLFFNQKSGSDFSLTYSLFHCKADLLIFGNSRAQHHYDTRIIADNLKISCFNAGIDGGQSILLPYAQIEGILKRYSPKIIILELDPASFGYDSRNYDILSVLLPYYQALPQLRSIILLRSPCERLKLLSGIYPFNSNIINMIRFNTNIHAARRKNFNGYVPIMNRQMKSNISNSNSKKMFSEVEDTEVVDSNLLEALKSIIQLCRKENIQLKLVNSPVYHNLGDHPVPISEAVKQVLALIHQERSEFIDFTLESSFAGRMDLFADKVHLNEKGATFFTRMLIQKLN